MVDENLCIILQLSHGDNTGAGTIDRIVLLVTTGSGAPVTLLILSLAIHWAQGRGGPRADLVNTFSHQITGAAKKYFETLYTLYTL